MSIDLVECLTLSEGGRAVRVDRERGVIHNVKVLGWKSANGREYLREGVKASLYEGRRVNAGHAPAGKDRSPLDTYGLLEGVKVAETGVYADRLRLLNPKGEFEQRLLSAAESAPHLFGLSHTARGREKQGSGGTVIEAVESVQSVDLVTDPATVEGFYESKGRFAVKKTVKQLAEALKASRPGLAKLYREMAEAGIVSPDAEMEEPPMEAPPAADHKQALKDACKALLDEIDTLGEAEVMKKLKALMKLIKGDTPGTGGGSMGGDDDDSDETEESRRLKAENGQLLAEKLVRRAAGKAKVALSETLVEAVARPGMTEAQADAVIAELKPGAGGGTGSQTVRSAGPIVAKPAKGGGGGTSGNVQESKVPDGDAKTVGKWLTGR